jgi:hypothetical protein
VYGIYAQVARSNPFVLRIQPPLTIEDEDIDHLLAALEVIAPDLANIAAMVDSIVAKSTLGVHEGDRTKRTGTSAADSASSPGGAPTESASAVP